MEPLVNDFENPLFDSELSDIGVDILEVGIDTVFHEGILQEIPIVRTIIGMGKAVQNVHDRNLLKQTIAFIQEFNNQMVSPDKINSYRQKIIENPKKREKELGRILILLNRNIDMKKSMYEGKFLQH